MAETMTRRTFLKGAAAAAVAVSLAGCGGGSTVGEFRVYFNGNPEFGWMISGDYGFVKLNIGIKGVENGITFSKKYSDVFSAEVNGQKLELQNGSTGILWQGSTKDCELEFRIADKETVDALASGAQTLDLTITLSVCAGPEKQDGHPAVKTKQKELYAPGTLCECPGLFAALPNQKMVFSAHFRAM